MAGLSEDEQRMVEALKAAGHEPKLDARGEVDFWAMDIEPEDDIPHNGPQCVRCLDSWCVNCWAKGRETETIRTCPGERRG